MNRLLRRTLFCLSLFLLLWLSGLVWFVSQIPAAVEAQPKVDAIVVLTGDSGRLERGMELLAQGKGKVLFISGVSKRTSLEDILHYATPDVLHKLDSNDIILGHEAENTIGNAGETTKWLREEGYKTITLVTSSYHVPRSLLEFREVAPDLVFNASPVFSDEFTISGWWYDKHSRILVLLEYHKFLASKLRHWFVSNFNQSQNS